MYSTFNIFTSTFGQFKKFQLLDIIRFEVSPKNERLDWLEFITGITYQYDGLGSLRTNLTINKESPVE